MNTEIIVKTPRMVVRQFTLDDVDALAPIMADPDVMRFSLKGPKSVAQTRQMIVDLIKSYQKHGFGLWAIINKLDNKLIGFCGLAYVIVDGKKQVELIYRLDKEHWRQGLATEAARAVLKYALKKLGMDEIIAIISPENPASVRVAQKVGMQLLKDSRFHGQLVHIYHLNKDIANGKTA